MNAQNNQPKSKQFYWKIEDLWEKYYEKTEEKITLIHIDAHRNNAIF